MYQKDEVSVKMCYNKSTLNKKPTSQMFSNVVLDLIQVSNVTEKLEGSRFPQTTTEYRCSNLECQNEKDKQTAKRIQLQKEKESG